MNSTKTECKATFVGFCALPGPLSESHVFQCVCDLIALQNNHNQQQFVNSSSTESSKGSLNVKNKEVDNEVIFNDENKVKTDLWTVSIEANELKWFLSDDSSAQITGQRKCNRANFTNILFCYLNAQLPNVIVWVLTNKDCDDSNNGKVETKALVWQCLNDKDAIHLRDAYKLIRSRKKLEKIEAINKAKQKNSEKLIVIQKLGEKINGNDSEHQTNISTSFKHEIKEIINKPLNTNDQHLVSSEANEILEDLLYRSTKPNPNREILVASSVHLKNSRNNKSHNRQRQPALLLQANHNNASHSSHLTSTTTPRQVNNNVIPIVVSHQNNSYWNQYPSESEFDTTRIDSYLNALNLSRRNRTNVSSSKQNGKQMRSRSVETPLNRLRMSIHKPVNSFLNAINSPSGAKMSSSNTTQTSNSNNNQSRAVLVTRSESLNSEGSSVSGESGICEFNSHSSHPAKSVLKKTNPTAVHIGPGKKNVTFSAYATIQVMDG